MLTSDDAADDVSFGFSMPQALSIDAIRTVDIIRVMFLFISFIIPSITIRYCSLAASANRSTILIK